MNVSEEEKVGTSLLKAESFHTDFTGQLMLGVLGNELLNCADTHAEQRGFGMTRLNESRCTWVLSRLVIEMKRMPRRQEQFCIRTWIENVYRLFTDRDFEVTTPDGETLGYARSIWAMIDMESRKPVDLLTLHGEQLTAYVCAKECPIDRPGRIRIRATEPVVRYTVRYSDIDMNGHVNSIKYVEHILNLFPPEEFRRHRIGRFEIAYHAESRYGDVLLFYCEETGDGEYSIEIRKEDGGEMVCRAKVTFTVNS